MAYKLRVPVEWKGVPEITESTYGEIVVFKNGIADVQTEAAYRFLLNSGYLPVEEK